MKDFLKRHSAGAVYGAVVGVVITSLIGDFVDKGVDSFYAVLPQLFDAIVVESSLAERSIIISLLGMICSGFIRRSKGYSFLDPDVAVQVGINITMVSAIIFMSYSYFSGVDLEKILSEPLNKLIISMLFLETVVFRCVRLVRLHRMPNNTEEV